MREKKIKKERVMKATKKRRKTTHFPVDRERLKTARAREGQRRGGRQRRRRTFIVHRSTGL